MIYPLVSKETWSRIYDISPASFTCSCCGKEYAVDVPVAMRGLRGFVSTPHECGAKFNRGIYYPFQKEDKILLENIYYGLCENGAI
jgi:ribosomal protein L37AE/L43A